MPYSLTQQITLAARECEVRCATIRHALHVVKQLLTYQELTWANATQGDRESLAKLIDEATASLREVMGS